MLQAPYMFMIGSSGRNSGKTEFACSLIGKFCAGHKVVGVKVTTIQERDGLCPRGGEGCRICSSLEGDYHITEESEANGAKDTHRLLAAGAHNVYWLRVLRDRLEDGAAALLRIVGEDARVVCESNSLRAVVEPGLFFMVHHRDRGESKGSAKAVAPYVDVHVVYDGVGFNVDLNDIEVVDGKWAYGYPDKT